MGFLKKLLPPVSIGIEPVLRKPGQNNLNLPDREVIFLLFSVKGKQKIQDYQLHIPSEVWAIKAWVNI